MKLAQRVALGYYRNKLKTIAFVSPRTAAAKAFQLFCTPYTKRKTYLAPAIFNQGTKVSLEFSGFQINGFKWQLEELKVSKGKVLIVHGFDSNSYRFEKYITPLLDLGFEVLAFDAPAHGLSSGTTITVDVYRDLIIEVSERFGPLTGIMAHSLGALAAALAAEKKGSSLCNKLILIAPSTETTYAIDVFFSYLPLPAVVKEEFEKIIQEKGGHPSKWYSVARAIQNISTPTLWIHDKEDSVTPFKHMSHLVNSSQPNVEFLLTEGLGHSPYTNDNVCKKILEYVTIRLEA